MAKPEAATTAPKLVVAKWSRYSEAEADGLRLLAAQRRLSVARLIRALSLEGLQRARVPVRETPNSEEARASA